MATDDVTTNTIRLIDAKPKFIFDSSPAAHPNAIPFDMFQGDGFGHEATTAPLRRSVSRSIYPTNGFSPSRTQSTTRTSKTVNSDVTKDYRDS